MTMNNVHSIKNNKHLLESELRSAEQYLPLWDYFPYGGLEILNPSLLAMLSFITNQWRLTLKSTFKLETTLVLSYLRIEPAQCACNNIHT